MLFDYLIEEIRICPGEAIVSYLESDRTGWTGCHSRIFPNNEEIWNRRILNSPESIQNNFVISPDKMSVVWPDLDLEVSRDEIFEDYFSCFSHKWKRKSLKTELSHSKILGIWEVPSSLLYVDLKDAGKVRLWAKGRSSGEEIEIWDEWMFCNGNRFQVFKNREEPFSYAGGEPTYQIGAQFDIVQFDGRVLELLTRPISIPAEMESSVITQSVWWKKSKGPKKWRNQATDV